MKRRSIWIVWIAGALAVTAGLALRLQSTDRGMFLPGRTTSGHYQIELSCNSCHTPFKGVDSAACVNCHGQDLKDAQDSHPRSKFTDPRNADRISRLDATSCVACHVEHRPEMTSKMGVTLPVDFCFYCHSDIGKERPGHKNMAFDTCASSGCHKFHDNRALYADFLVKHRAEPDILESPVAMRRDSSRKAAVALAAAQYDSPRSVTPNPPSPSILDAWASTAHAREGVNCTGCHSVPDAEGNKQWKDRPGYQSCQSCHKNETDGFLGGKHGMRLAANLTPMSPALARRPMAAKAVSHTLGCASCHSAHAFDTRRAAADACLECHADKHSLAYKSSPHFALWRAEIDGSAAVGSGVSCATCHLPRLIDESGETRTVGVQHNQNRNLEPSEKMIREVCMSCHGLGFSIDALADRRLVEANFSGRPSRHIESIEMAVKKAAR